MITLEDCLAFCDLTEEEVLAIAEHEQLPEIAAIAMGQYMLGQEPLKTLVAANPAAIMPSGYNFEANIPLCL